MPNLAECNRSAQRQPGINMLTTLPRCVLAVTVLALVGCQGTKPTGPSIPTVTGSGPMVSIDLSGTEGAPFSGFVVQGGQRIVVTGKLPWSLSEPGITEFEFLKIRPSDVLNYSIRYDNRKADAHASQSGQIPSGRTGLRGQVVGLGLSVTSF